MKLRRVQLRRIGLERWVCTRYDDFLTQSNIITWFFIFSVLFNRAKLFALTVLVGLCTLIGFILYLIDLYFTTITDHLHLMESDDTVMKMKSDCLPIFVLKAPKLWVVVKTETGSVF